MAAPTYHFWIKPTGEPYALFAGIIRDLARQFGVQPFEPHVTLLATLEGTEAEHVQRARELSTRLRPVRDDADRTGVAGRTLPIAVHARRADAGGDERPRGGADAVRPLGRGVHAAPEPCVYGMLPEDVKRSVAATLPAGGRTSFTVRSLILLRSEGLEPEDWHEILELPFRG